MTTRWVSITALSSEEHFSHCIFHNIWFITNCGIYDSWQFIWGYRAIWIWNKRHDRFKWISLNLTNTKNLVCRIAFPDASCCLYSIEIKNRCLLMWRYVSVDRFMYKHSVHLLRIFWIHLSFQSVLILPYTISPELCNPEHIQEIYINYKLHRIWGSPLQINIARLVTWRRCSTNHNVCIDKEHD